MKNLAQRVTCVCPRVEELRTSAPVLGLKTPRSEVVSRTVNRELDTVLRQHRDTRLRPVMVGNMLGSRQSCHMFRSLHPFFPVGK